MGTPELLTTGTGVGLRWKVTSGVDLPLVAEPPRAAVSYHKLGA